MLGPQELGITTETLEHAAAPTVDEHSTHLQHLTNCGQAKNLCVRWVPARSSVVQGASGSSVSPSRTAELRAADAHER